MVIGITHGKNKNGESSLKEPSVLSSQRNDTIVIKFIDGPKKN